MYLAAFLLGLFGGVHCAGMCGPIALSISAGGRSGWKFFRSRILYNLGRISTYALLGGWVALLGMGAKLAEWQQAFSIALGVMMLIWAIAYLGWIKFPVRWRFADRVLASMRSWMSGMLREGSGQAMFTVGLLNGLLPCGLLYLGLFQAAWSMNAVDGMIIMALFGAGTFPVMFGITVLGKFIGTGLRTKVNKVLPYGVLVLAILFFVRGLSLGIPYLSPKFEADAAGNVTASCCDHPPVKE